MLPNFLVIGAHKAGTTSLFRYLDAHPDIFMPRENEVHFFTDHNWARGVEWYESFFAGAGGARAIGEKSVGYSAWPFFEHVPERAATVVPGARLVYVVRDPLARMLSQFRHDLVEGFEWRPIDEALLDWKKYIARSMYALQIDQWLEHGWPRQQMCIVTDEDLRDDRPATVARVYGFLGVDPDFRPRDLSTNFNRGAELRVELPVVKDLRSRPLYAVARRLVPEPVRRTVWRALSKPSDPSLTNLSIRPETRAAILEQLRPDLERLGDHLGGDFDAWGLLHGADS